MSGFDYYYNPKINKISNQVSRLLMRFLRNKILRAHGPIHNYPSLVPNVSPPPSQELHNTFIQAASIPYNIDSKTNQPKRGRPKHLTETPPKPDKGTKNIVINYGKALSSFATSPLALPYLQTLADEEVADIPDFIKFMSRAKDNISGIAGLSQNPELFTHVKGFLK